MTYRTSIALNVLLACVWGLALSPALAEQADCAHVEQQVTELTKRIETMERKLAAAQTALANRARAPQAARPKPTAKKPKEIDPIYGEIDGLLSKGEIQAAKQVLADRVESLNGQVTSVTKTLTRELGVVGEPTPSDWELQKWFQGESETDLDGKGTTLLLFWEAWCPYCKKEMPRFQKLYRQYRTHGLQVVGLTRLSRDATETAVREVLTQNSVEFPVAKESGAMAKYFHVKGIPATAVVKDGKIIWRGHPLRLTDEMLAGWL